MLLVARKAGTIYVLYSSDKVITRRGIIIYMCTIPRVPECLSLSLRRNLLPPPLIPPASVSPPPPPLETGGRVRGRVEPIRTTGEKAWHSVYSYLQNIVF
jgi:hypothetical protein